MVEAPPPTSTVSGRTGTRPVGGAAAAHREIKPTDGAIAHFGDLVSIYCAPCLRWIDCHEGIPPDTALARHSVLLH